jgi:hypothetical protein
MKPDAASAVVDEAHKRKLKVFADAPALAEAKTLAKAGVDALISSVRDHDVDDELVSLMKDKKIPLSPALTALESKFVYAEKTSWLGEVAMREAYPPSISAYLSETVIMNKFKRNPQIGAFRQEFATASKNLKKLADAGVPIVLGSGSGLPDTFPGYFEHRELALMVNAGMTPLAAINAATSVSAEVLGATDLGTLEPGKKGSFIVFASNPIEDIKNTRDIDKVFVEGHPIDRLDMIRKIQVERPKVSAADIATDAEIQQREREEAEDRNLPKYGKFAMGGNVNVAPGLIIQIPKRSKGAAAGGGPPYRVTVQLARATGADLKAFYSALLPKAKWTASGDCWDKPNPAQPGKNFHLCTDPGQSQITLNISVQ